MAACRNEVYNTNGGCRQGHELNDAAADHGTALTHKYTFGAIIFMQRSARPSAST
jgi:hypothetical protein